MARQVKSVSIPERLQARVQEIPNFTQWVISALENPAEAEAVSQAATNRRVHLLHLEHVTADLEDLRQCVRRIKRTQKRQCVDARHLDGLETVLEDLEKEWTATLGRLRRQ